MGENYTRTVRRVQLNISPLRFVVWLLASMNCSYKNYDLAFLTYDIVFSF